MPLTVNTNTSATTASFQLSAANAALRKSLGRYVFGKPHRQSCRRCGRIVGGVEVAIAIDSRRASGRKSSKLDILPAGSGRRSAGGGQCHHPNVGIEDDQDAAGKFFLVFQEETGEGRQGSQGICVHTDADGVGNHHDVLVYKFRVVEHEQESYDGYPIGTERQQEQKTGSKSCPNFLQFWEVAHGIDNCILLPEPINDIVRKLPERQLAESLEGGLVLSELGLTFSELTAGSLDHFGWSLGGEAFVA